MRTLCSATLISECLIVGLVGLVAFRMTDVPAGTLWAVCGVVMALCVLLCGFVTRPGGVAMGWALQAGLVLSGFLVPMMFFLGACFAGLWWASVHFGRRVDEMKAAHAAQA
ncbi:DUF4233 domain-containing protein [Streptomyces lonarensis]|uniref:DUF4233 domain-containing protein n=1 Tax=Streptomyces lonarensis TaxID=700599 RepID=A0A7X6CYG5_9ACTN|nr:DUF4233 domain-containing protein [Streptomyces lonarensis]NJQ04750.1 DUF4233 domain-containing protein [Streptomyces lonarensis]